jgi:hypothetical protein
MAVRDLVTNKSPPPTDVVMASLYMLLTGAPATPDVQYAWDLFRVDEHRAQLDAFLLAKAPLDLVSRVLSIPLPVMEAYSHLFLDMSALRNRLEILSYAAAYDGPASAKELIKAAMSIGLEYLHWLHGVSPEVEPSTVVRRTMVDAFYRGMAHKGNALSTNIAKEAHKWWGMAIRNAELLEKLDPKATQDAYESLRIALESRDDTVPAALAPVPLSEMMH